jgi:dTMP kinase
MDMAALRCLERIAVGDTEPDLRFLLDLPVEVGLARRHRDVESVNRIDRAGVAFHERVRDAYRQLATERPGAWAVIDATQSPENVLADICRTIRATLAIPVGLAGTERRG